MGELPGGFVYDWVLWENIDGSLATWVGPLSIWLEACVRRGEVLAVCGRV